jgi:acyl carrier protein
MMRCLVKAWGSDSIDALELGIALQKVYGIEIDEDDDSIADHFKSVRALADFIRGTRRCSIERRPAKRFGRSLSISWSRCSNSLQGRDQRSHLYDDLGIDSIDAVDLIVRLKELTGKKVEPEEFKEIRTVTDVVDAIEGLLKS